MREYLPEFMQRGMRAIDNWVSANVSKQTQNLFILGLVFIMCIHLVYTKRKVQALHKEQLKQEREKKKEK